MKDNVEVAPSKSSMDVWSLSIEHNRSKNPQNIYMVPASDGTKEEPS